MSGTRNRFSPTGAESSKWRRVKSGFLSIASLLVAFVPGLGLLVIGWICAINSIPGYSQTPPTVSPVLQQVVKLTQAHMGDDVILTYVKGAGGAGTLSAEDVLYLSGQGVSQNVLATLVHGTGSGDSVKGPAQPTETSPSEPLTAKPGERFPDATIALLNSQSDPHFLNDKLAPETPPDPDAITRLTNSPDQLVATLAAEELHLIGVKAEMASESNQLAQTVQNSGGQLMGVVAGMVLGGFLSDSGTPSTREVGAGVAGVGRPVQMAMAEMMKSAADGIITRSQIARDLRALATRNGRGAIPGKDSLIAFLDARPDHIGSVVISNATSKTLRHCLIIVRTEMDKERIIAPNPWDNFFSGVGVGLGIPSDFVQNAGDLGEFKNELMSQPEIGVVYVPELRAREKAELLQVSPDLVNLAKEMTVSLWSDELAIEDATPSNRDYIRLETGQLSVKDTVVSSSSSDPASSFIQAMRGQDFKAVFGATLDYRQRVTAVERDKPQADWAGLKSDVLNGLKTSFDNGQSAFGELPNLLDHDCAVKIVERRSGGEAGDFVSEVVQLEYKKPADAPIVGGKFLRKTSVKLDFLTGNYAPEDGDPGFTLAAVPARVDGSDAAWENPPVRLLLVTENANGQGDNLLLTTLGGKPPFTVTFVAGDRRLGAGQFTKPLTDTPISFDHTLTAATPPTNVNLFVVDAGGDTATCAIPLGRSAAWMDSALMRHNAWRTSFGQGSSANRFKDLLALNSLSPSEISATRETIKTADAQARLQRDTVTMSGANGVLVYEFLAYPKEWSAPVLVPYECNLINQTNLEPGQIRLSVDGAVADPRNFRAQGGTAMRFMSASKDPVPTAVRLIMRPPTNEERSNGSFTMPPWPPVKASANGPPERLAAYQNIAGLLKQNAVYHGTAFQNRSPMECSARLSLDAKTGYVTGWIEFVSLKAIKKIEGRIIDDGITPVSLQLKETGSMDRDPSSRALVGIYYSLLAENSAGTQRLSGSWKFQRSYSGTLVLEPGEH
jgi:hypothetical protein